jgi:SLT domain-containing protein
MWNAIKNTAESVWGAIKSGFKSFAGAVEDTLSGLVSKAKSIWNKIVDVFKTPVNAVIGIWDVVAGAVGLPKISKLADGGEVRGPGTSTSDSIPAMLSNGEFVVNAAAVSHYGLDHMYDLNSMRLAGGGLVGNSTVSNQNPGTIGGEKTNNLGVGVGLLDGVPTAMETAVAALGIHIPNPIDVIKKAVGGAAKAAAGAISDVVGFAKKNAGTLVGAGGILAPDALKFAKDITGDLVYDFAKPLVDAVVSKVPDPAPPGTPKPAGSVAHAGVKKIADSALGLLKDKQKIAVESQAVAGTKSVQAWAPTVMQALKMEGLPESWLGKILSMMQQESGGNPNAINRTDINAKNGVPSQGLMQVIPPTFAAYHWPGTSNNILDPLANIAAALNYIKHRYGYPPGSPYASGTNNATPGVHLVGENGPEMVLFGGGETVKNASETSTILGSSSAAAGGPPPNVANGPATSDKQLADSLAAWQNYMAQIQNISDTTWGEVSTTAAANWTDMQSNSDPFVTTMTKKFGDAGAAIQTKWAADLTAGTAATTASFDAQAAAASTFGTEIQKTYTDTAAAIETTWSQSLASSAAATTQYWTDVSGANASGTESLQTDLINPVSTMLTTQLPAAFNQSITAIGTGWENLKKTVRDPVAAVVDVVFNKGIVAMWNAIAGTFDAPTLDTFTMPAYATGGAVSGPGTGTSDSIMARLSHGEHVWTAAEVAAAGGHANVAALRSAALGGDTVRMIGANGRYADGGAVVGAPQGGTSSTQGATLTGDPLKDAANATLGSIKDISNPFITAAGDAGKSAIANLLPGTSAFGTLLNNAVDMMVNTVTGWITANDVLPTIGGANDAAAQAWADAQVGKPYALGGNFGATFDCSQYMSGIARAILGETPAPWFTTFAFDGDTAPTGFERGLTAPFMIGITNVGVGHTAGTLNGTNYEATPPAVRSGPSARGYDDPMFQDWYGFRPSIEASVGAVTDQNHLAIIDAAMAAAGVPPPDSVAAWEAGMNTIIIRESNWDPNAINNYDSNAAAGMPSQGLAQVIPPTFAAYHVAGTSNNILDPIANVAAAINYIVHTYGSIGNVQQANPNLPPKGYAHGTWGAQTGWHRVGEDGPEWVKFRGGEQVFPNGIHPGGGGETHVTVENHFHGPATKEAMQYAEGTFSENLRRAVHAGVGKKR